MISKFAGTLGWEGPEDWRVDGRYVVDLVGLGGVGAQDPSCFFVRAGCYNAVKMAAVTLHLTDELAGRLRGQEEHLPEILELGLRDINANSQAGFDGATEVLEVLATLPSPQEVMALRPSARLTARIEELLEKNREGGLTAAEQREWERYEYLEHLVRVAKARASRRLSETPGHGGD